MDFIKNNLNKIILAISILGILLSLYLWNIQVQDPAQQLIPCTADGGCEEVLTSDVSKLFGVPIAVFGVFYYVILGLLAFQREFITHQILDKLLLVSILWGIIFSLYLRYLEFVEIGHVCVWCWVSVLFIVLITILYLWEEKLRKTKNKQIND